MLKLMVLSRKRNVLEVAVTENKGRCGLFHYRYLTPGEELSIPLSSFEQEVEGGVFGLSESGMKKIRAKAVLGISATRKYGKRTYEVHLVKGNVKDVLSPSLMEFKPKSVIEKTCPLETVKAVQTRLKNMARTMTVHPAYLKAAMDGFIKLEAEIKVMVAANNVLLENQATLNTRIDKLTEKLTKVNK